MLLTFSEVYVIIEENGGVYMLIDTELVAKIDDFNGLANKNNLSTRLGVDYSEGSTLVMGTSEQLKAGTYQCKLKSREKINVVDALIKFVCFENGE